MDHRTSRLNLNKCEHLFGTEKRGKGFLKVKSHDPGAPYTLQWQNIIYC